MDERRMQTFFDNMAEVKSAERVQCEDCPEQLVFWARDPTGEFPIGLRTILQCLEFAVLNGDLPKLPSDWTSLVEGSLGVPFDDDSWYLHLSKADQLRFYGHEIFQNGPDP